MSIATILEQQIDQKTQLKPWAMPETIRTRFRALRASLTASLAEGRVIAVTSHSRGEGVSWVCSRLACALAESGRPTVLVDAHAAHPSQFSLFGVAGRVPERAADLRKWQICTELAIAEVEPDMSLETLKPAISRLALPGRLVLIDCAPFAAGAMVLELGSVLDGVLFIVEAGNQRREMLAQAILQTKRAGLRIIGTVVNKHRQYVPSLLD